MGDRVEGEVAGGGRWPFAGRAEALATVLAVDRAGGAGVLVVAPAGAGRTRFLDEVGRALADRRRVVPVAGSAGVAGVALASVAPLLRHAVPTGADAARAVLADLAPTEPTVFLVDDAELLDPESATALALLAGQPDVLLVVASRRGAAPDGPLHGRWRDGLLTRLDLPPLDVDAGRDLLEAALGGPVDGGVAHGLVGRSGGDLGLLRELLDAASADGALRLDGGVWRLTRPVPASPAIADRVAHRLAGAGPDARAALEVLAVAGPLRAEAAAAVVDADVFERLEADGLVAVSVDRRGRARLTTVIPLVGEVVGAGIPVLRRHRLGALVAGAIDDLVARDVASDRDRLQAARLRLDAGQVLAADDALRSAHEAWRRFDPVLTERLADAAVSAGAGFDAEVLAARAVAQQGRPDEADDRLARLVASASTDAERVAAADARAEQIVFYGQDATAAIAALEAVERLVTDPAGRITLAAKRGLLLHSAGESVAALELLEPLLDELDGDTLLAACFAVAVGATATGRASVAVAACDRAEAAPHPGGWDPLLVELSRCAALALAGDLAAALDLTRRHYDQAVADGARHRQALFAWARGGVLISRGHAAAAARWCAEARSILGELAQRPAERLVANDLARSLALAGRPDEADAVLDAVDGVVVDGPPVALVARVPAVEADPAGPGGLFGEDAVRLVVRGWIAASRGDVAGGRERLLASAERHARRGHHYPTLHALVDVARIGGAASVRDRVRAVGPLVEGPLAAAQVDLVDALAQPTTGVLPGVGDRFEALGWDLLAAECWATEAVRLDAVGDRRPAASARRRCAELLGRCGGPVTPLVRAGDRASALSAREQEVARRASAGRSNRDIAEELVLSVRTVETHLQRAYQKLGITRRDELAAALAVRS